jgi:catechol 2,3-dioxygenase-like lactoylglutathione lyase family enzyme
MPLGMDHKISDVCMLCSDLERSIAFYQDQCGFRLRRKDPGFADFHAAGITLALWEIAHVAEHVGFPDVATGRPAHKVMTAVNLPDAATVDRVYEELVAKGVEFLGPPKLYPWNAHCAYFADPDGNTWELYSWAEGGPFKGERPDAG